MTLSGCSESTKPAVTPNPMDAVAEVTRPLMDTHVDALLSDNPDAMIVSGAALISTLDAILPEVSNANSTVD